MHIPTRPFVPIPVPPPSIKDGGELKFEKSPDEKTGETVSGDHDVPDYSDEYISKPQIPNDPDAVDYDEKP